MEIQFNAKLTEQFKVTNITPLNTGGGEDIQCSLRFNMNRRYLLVPSADDPPVLTVRGSDSVVVESKRGSWGDHQEQVALGCLDDDDIGSITINGREFVWDGSPVKQHGRFRALDMTTKQWWILQLGSGYA